MDYKEMLEREKFEKLIRNYECFTYRVAVPIEGKEKPMAIFHGEGSTMDIACMINFLEGSLKKIKQNFPEAAFISKQLGKNNVSESYKRFE